MATVIIHEVDDQALARLRDEAEAQGSSIEAELRAFIEERGRDSELDRRRRAAESIRSMRVYRELILAKYGPMSGQELLRQERGSW